MIRVTRFARKLAVLTLLGVAGWSGLSAADQRFTTSPSVSQEAMTLIQLLEQAHLNRDAVGTDYSQVVPDYMEDLDGQRLFFLKGDLEKFSKLYAKNAYYNVRFVGNINPAYDIFYTYHDRVEKRVKWIFEQLAKDFDFNANESYRVDRSKAEWPADMAQADDLWRRRLKYELIAEILSSQKKAEKTAEASVTPVPPAAGTPASPESLTPVPPASAGTAASAARAATDNAAVAVTSEPAPQAPAAGTAAPVPPTVDATNAVATASPKSALDAAKEKIRKRYERMLKNVTEIEQIELAELYLSTIARLYDPHSTYFSAKTFEDFAIQMKLQLVGIGALLGLEEDTCLVKEIIPGGPADLAKELKPNDKIIAVGQPGQEPVDVYGMKLRNIVDMIRGKKGTNVHLIVQPAEAPESTRREIVITRDVVKLDAQRARAAVFQLPGKDGKTQPIGVITLPAFYGPADDGDTDSPKPAAAKDAAGKDVLPETRKSSASGDVARLIADLKLQNVQGIVLDLRRNGGGYLSEAIELAGLFINRGPVVQVKNYNGEIQIDEDENPEVAYAGPLAVLVDRFSASASEIVSGALQNYGRAVVIGDTSTHGKGSVQQVVELKQITPALARSAEPTGAAKFTIQKYYLPSGASTQLKGVVPDIVLPSIDEFIPNIGEADLPRALAWDQIPTSFFDGQPLDVKFMKPLREASLERQARLEEFAYLKKNVEWFKNRQEQKLISVNLSEREKQKARDEAFRKEMKSERERIAKGDYAYTPIYLGAPPAPKIKAPPSDDEEVEIEENDTYSKADIHLREALRIVADAIQLGNNRELWVSNHPPLTVVASTPRTPGS